MLLLKIIAACVTLVLLLYVLVLVGSRLRPYYDRWYLSRLDLEPEVIPNQLDDQTIAQLNDHFSDGDFGKVVSFIVWQDGEKRYEYNAPNTTSDTMVRVWSVSKSVLSAAYGAAVQQGRAAPLDSPIAEHLPQYADQFKADPRRAQISIEDLFTMRSGFVWNELNSFPNDYHQFAASADWVAYMADREMDSKPGESFTYNTANSILLGEVIGGQVGQPFEQFVEEALFQELGITQWKWEYGPNDVVQSGGGLHLSANDMLKIGKLYLNNGEWNGKQLVDPSWVTDSISYKTEVPGYLDYGYHWWLAPEDSELIEALEVKDVYFASGLGGNYVYVIPHLNTIVVVAASDSNGQMERSWPALRYFVFPALTGEAQK